MIYLVVYLVSMWSIVCLLNSVCLHLASKWSKAKKPDFKRALLISAMMILAAFLVLFIFSLPFRFRLEAAGVGLIAYFISFILVIKKGFGLSLVRAFQAFAMMLLLETSYAYVFQLVGVKKIVSSHFAETCVLPSMDMAPTILGKHLRVNCPNCDSAAYCRYFGLPKGDPRAETSRYAICKEHFHVTRVKPDTSRLPFAADRFLVANGVKPKRWDLVAFRPPSNDKTVYLKRLVGLPGEVVTIIQGRVHIDGKPIPIPAEIEDIRFEKSRVGSNSIQWGTKENPAILDDNEYFVLGDFAVCSRDSRNFGKAFGDHSSYAIPSANIEGVAVGIYWPPTRWRSF